MLAQKVEIICSYLLILEQMGKLSFKLVNFLHQKGELIGIPELCPQMLITLFQRKSLNCSKLAFFEQTPIVFAQVLDFLLAGSLQGLSSSLQR